MFFLILTLTSIAYSPLIKRLPVAKNLYVSFYCASLLLHAGHLGGDVYPTVMPALITVTCLTARELLMDICDIDGDRYSNYRTIPILFGVNVSRRIIVSLLGLTGFLQILLLSGIGNGHFAKVLLLASLSCFWGVAIYVSLIEQPSNEKLRSQIRILMLGISVGVLAIIL
jgi:4-hydroxybenzoate polyprenyltransferase